MGIGSLGWEDSQEEDMETHSSAGSCLENPMDRGTCGLQSIGSQNQT